MKLNDEEIQELRERFGDDVQVTDKLPSPKEVVERDSWLERIVGTVGLEKWMWKSRRGLLIAIIVVPPGVSGLVEFWSPPVTAAMEYARPYISVVENTGLQFGERLIAFLPEPTGDEAPPLADRAILIPAVGQPITAPVGVIELDATVYRLVDPRFDPLDGWGTRNYGGRWSSPGPSLLYTSDSVLAAIEELKQYLPLERIRTFMLHEIGVAGMAEALQSSSFKLALNDDWQATRQIGDDWFRRGETGLMIAPSRVDPEAHTVVINLERSQELGLRIIRSTPVNILPT